MNKKHFNITEILKSNKKIKFSIMNYQRAFEWDFQEIKSLYLSIKKELFFGVSTFVWTKGKNLEIIDGQQRLISIAIIFGGRVQNINFEFNIDSTTDNTLLNKVLNSKEGEIKTKDIKNSYILYIKNLKSRIWEFLESEGITDKKLREIWETLYFPFVQLVNNKISESFIAMNSSGKLVDKTEIAKALTLNKITLKWKKEKLIKIWNDFIKTYHLILFNKGTSRVSKEQLFFQAMSYKEKGVAKISKQNLPKFSTLESFKILLEYTKWAEEIIPGIKPRKNLGTLSSFNQNLKINPYAPILSYHISKLGKGIKDSERKSAYVYLAVYNNLFNLSDTPLSKYEDFFNLIIKLTSCKKMISLIKEQSKDLIKKSRDEMIKNWNSRKEISGFRYKYKENKNSLDSLTSKYNLVVLEMIFKSIKDKKIKYKDTIKLNDSTSLEHILNKNQNKFEYFTFLPEKTNNSLGTLDSKNIFGKIKLYMESKSKYPKNSSHKTNTLSKAIKIINNKKENLKISEYKNKFAESWKIK